MRNEEIWNVVEDLRSKHVMLSGKHLPMDLISFVELDLRMDLIPYDSLKANFGADAAILADFSGIYIDGEIFERIDVIRGSPLNRLRFSIAHELGHLFLHRDAFESAGIDSLDHLLEWLNEHNGCKYEFEREANEFAGRLLVPVDVLRECYDRMLPTMDAQYGRHVWVSNAEIRGKTAELIAPRFGVHPIAIETRFDREGIWPSPF